MRKLFAIAAIGAFGLTLSSCGGGADPEAAAKEVCECYKGAGTDMDKMQECTKKSMDVAQQFKDDIESAKKYSQAIINCATGE